MLKVCHSIILLEKFLKILKSNAHEISQEECGEAGNEKHYSAKPSSHTAYLAYYANASATKLVMPRFVAVHMVLLVLAPTQASGISRHRFGQGLMSLTTVG